MNSKNKKRLTIFLVLLTAIFLVLITSLIVFSQSQNQNQNNQNVQDITQTLSFWSGVWWLFLIGGIIAIPLGYILAGRVPELLTKILTIGGFFAIFMAIIIAESLYVWPLFSGVLNLFKGDLALVDCVEDINPIKDLPQFIAYTFSGYCIYAQNYVAAIAVWIIFVLILPLAILIALFWDFSEGMFKDKRVRNVVSFSGALIAYRVLMSTFFINFLSYGFGGIALLFFHWLFFRWGTRAVVRIVSLKIRHKVVQQEIKKQQQEARNLRKEFARRVYNILLSIDNDMDWARRKSGPDVTYYLESIKRQISEIENLANSMLSSTDKRIVEGILRELRDNAFPESNLFDGILENFKELLARWMKE